MSLIYIPMGGKMVICPDAGCEGCEHGEPHEFDTVESSCTEGGDNNCPPCVEVAEYEKRDEAEQMSARMHSPNP